MKLFYIWILFSICGFLQSQIVVTNRIMHNYNVGDTIQWSTPFNGCGSPPSKQERVVLQKQLNSNNVIYTFKDTYNPICGPNCSIHDKVLTYTVQINDLDSSAVFLDTANYLHCTYNSSIDSIYTDQNLQGKKIYKRKYKFDPDTSTQFIACKLNGVSSLIEGIGEFYAVNNIINADNCAAIKTLEFYHKVGEAPYGTRVILPSGNKIPIEENLLIYPTVIVDHLLKIDYKGEDEPEMLILGTDGRLFLNEKISNDINVFDLNLNPGIYILKIYSKDSFNLMHRKIVIK